jgi:glycosyltransferase involved in cell wall biosynthesis
MIAILLCTYNGELYVKEQLDSLIKQTYKDFVIYIHDDGSKDATLDIIREYQTLFKDKIVLVNDQIKHRGAAESFLWLMNSVSADYYMFCDQDDIWLENKILHSYNRIKEIEKEHSSDTPVLIHTDLTLVDENSNVLAPSFFDYAGLKPDVSKHFKFLVFGNVVTGCTVIINDALKRIVPPLNKTVGMHDYWIALIAAKYGMLDNIKEQTILYRQHGDNVAGAGVMFKRKVKGLRSTFDWYKSNKDLLTELNYGNKFYLAWNKVIYTLKRYL